MTLKNLSSKNLEKTPTPTRDVILKKNWKKKIFVNQSNWAKREGYGILVNLPPRAKREDEGILADPNTSRESKNLSDIGQTITSSEARD